MCNPNTGTAVDKKREDFNVVRTYGMNWKPSNKHRNMHAHSHCIYMSDISESFHSLT